MFLIVCFHFSRRLPDRRRHKTNKGRTNRRSLPNCQQNGRIAARRGRLAFRDRAFWQKEGHPAARRRCGRRRRCTGRWHGAGQRNGGGGAGGGGAGGGGAPAVGTGAGRRRGCTGGDAGVPAAKRRGGSRKGKTPADGTGPADRAAEEELRLRAQGGSAERQRRCTGRWHGGRSTGRQRRNTGRWHKAGRRNSRGGAGGRGGVPAASARRVSGTAEKVRTEEVYRPMARGPVGGADEPATKRSDGGRKEKLRPRARGPAGGTKKACAAAGPYPEVRTTLFIIGSVRRGYALQRRESSCRPT